MRTATSVGNTSLSLPPNSYIYNIVAVGEKLGVISSDDSLRIFDPQTLQTISDGIRRDVHKGLTCLERNRSDNNTVLTAGRDGKIRCWDIRAAEKTFELGSGTVFIRMLKQILRRSISTLCGFPFSCQLLSEHNASRWYRFIKFASNGGNMVGPSPLYTSTI